LIVENDDDDILRRREKLKEVPSFTITPSHSKLSDRSTPGTRRRKTPNL
jgi:hypothetical protein